MQFALLQSLVVVAMASMALGASHIPQCGNCADSETCPDDSDFLPVDPAVKAPSPATGWTKTYTAPKNEISVSFSDKKGSQAVIRDDSKKIGIASIQFDKKNGDEDGRYTATFIVPARQDCLFNIPKGFAAKDVAEIKTYLIQSDDEE